MRFQCKISNLGRYLLRFLFMRLFQQILIQYYGVCMEILQISFSFYAPKRHIVIALSVRPASRPVIYFQNMCIVTCYFKT